MIKKIAIISTIVIGLFSNAEITDSNFTFSPDVEILDFQKKMSHVLIGDIKKDFISEIYYAGQKWYLISKEGEMSYYIQKDPLTNKVSRIRIVYPYSDFETGRDLKHLEKQYGKPEYISDLARFTNEDQRVRVYVGKDVLVKSLKANKTIIDILNYNVNLEKLESDDIIYKSNRMIRY